MPELPDAESFQLANEAKFEECVPQPVSVAVGLLVQFQQRAARLAAEGCNAGTDMEEKESVKEMVAEVVEWILRRSFSRKCVVMATHRRKNWSRGRA